MADAIFAEEDQSFVPSALARGPWSPDAQHGGPPAALLARAVERFEGGEAMFVARLTIELLRPVPLTPLRIRSSFARPGKKVQLVEASMFAGDVQVARCVGLRIRSTDLPLPADLPETTPPPGPHTGQMRPAPWAGAIDYTAFHRDAVEHSFVAGGFGDPGPATDWIRLRVPLVAGEPTSPLCRVVAAADFGNGVSWVLDRRDGYSFINPDLTVYLHRYPTTDWVCLDARTEVAPNGVGLAESRLFDERGVIGRSVQSLLLDRTA